MELMAGIFILAAALVELTTEVIKLRQERSQQSEEDPKGKDLG